MRKQTKHIHPSAANFLYNRIGNLYSCKCGHCKNEAREVDCLYCKGECNAFASAKILEREENISPCRFYG